MKDKPFTFCKPNSDNIPSNIDQSTFNNERSGNYDVFGNDMPDEDEFEVDDDSIIDRNFLSNRDTMDEHFPDNEIV